MNNQIGTVKNLKLMRYNKDSYRFVDDKVAIEEPLEIIIDTKVLLKSKTISITMRTPGDDKSLALGFLLTEGIIHDTKQIGDVKLEENKITIKLSTDTRIDLEKLNRHFYTSSSCGICGKASIEAINTISDYEPIYHNLNVRPDVIKMLPEALRNSQNIFQQTGGLHAAAICDIDGQVTTIKEDVGRHNALDKLIGHFFINGTLPLDRSILLLSGRISFELVQKSIMAGIQCIVAVGAPSSLAIELAEEYDVTLVGFAKADRFNVYSGHQRIK